MNLSIHLENLMNEEISILLGKADSKEKAEAYITNYLQQKIGEYIIDLYNFIILPVNNEFQAYIEYTFQWNVSNTYAMLVYPKINLIKAFDHAMGVI